MKRLVTFAQRVATIAKKSIISATLPPQKQIAQPVDAMDLGEIVRKLNTFAPTTLAGSWDNVGLLVEPSPPHQVGKILLTNDLTEDVMAEALELKVNMILSYHPPIFASLKRLTQRTWKERIVIKCIENRIAVYSPHTAFDAIKGGVNDWLLKPFDGSAEVIEQVDSKCFATSGGYRYEVSLPKEASASKSMEQELLRINGVTLTNKNQYEYDDGMTTRLSLNCTHKALPKVISLTENNEESKPTAEVISLSKPPIPDHGPGRIMKLKSPVALSEAVDRVKKHLGLSHVRLAHGVGIDINKPLKKLAVCAGAGASVLRGVDAHLYITGEMSHHEVLDANHRGIHVILCEHSNTERGYLRELQKNLNDIFESRIAFCLSKTDSDPLKIV